MPQALIRAPAGMGADHGLLSILAIISLIAPVGVPILRQTWSRWLYAAPLGITALVFVTLFIEVQKAVARAEDIGGALGGSGGRVMAHQYGPSFTPAVGAYIVLICAIYLATRVFAKES